MLLTSMPDTALRLAVIDGRGSPLFEEIVASWSETVFDANYIGTELRLQATVTRIESSSIIAELDPRSIAPLRPWSSSSVDEDPDLVPQRLTERRDRTEHAAGTSRLVARATNGPGQADGPDEPADRTARQHTRAHSPDVDFRSSLRVYAA